MKVSLVVATGAHEGRVIPVTGSQFLIGRDPQCHLRPASQAISKLHCAVLVRDGKYVHVALGSLADEPSIRPSEHIFVGSKAPWFEITDDLPQRQEYD